LVFKLHFYIFDKILSNSSNTVPAISDERVIIEGPQSIRVRLKSKWRDDKESLLFTPSEFLERLVAHIPAPKFLTTPYYEVSDPPVAFSRNKNRAKENASLGHGFSNAHSKSTCSGAAGA
jgi:hypothetical protein